MAIALLDGALNVDEKTGKKIQLLSVLRQRHPDTLQTCVDTIGREDKEKKMHVEKVLLRISMVSEVQETSKTLDTQIFAQSGGGASDVILAVADADPSVRCAAVRSVMQRMSSDDLTEAEMVRVQRWCAFSVS